MLAINSPTHGPTGHPCTSTGAWCCTLNIHVPVTPAKRKLHLSRRGLKVAYRTRIGKKPNQEYHFFTFRACPRPVSFFSSPRPFSVVLSRWTISAGARGLSVGGVSNVVKLTSRKRFVFCGQYTRLRRVYAITFFRKPSRGGEEVDQKC